jgi:hypothetical protein
MNTSTRVMICSAALLLAACGGGSSDPVADVPVAGVPDEASASTAGMATWMTGLSANLSDSSEPLDTARFTPPSPDDADPETLK